MVNLEALSEVQISSGDSPPPNTERVRGVNSFVIFTGTEYTVSIW